MSAEDKIVMTIWSHEYACCTGDPLIFLLKSSFESQYAHIHPWSPEFSLPTHLLPPHLQINTGNDQAATSCKLRENVFLQPSSHLHGVFAESSLPVRCFDVWEVCVYVFKVICQRFFLPLRILWEIIIHPKICGNADSPLSQDETDAVSRTTTVNWESSVSFWYMQSEGRISCGCSEKSTWSLSLDYFYAHEHTAIIKQNLIIYISLRRRLEPGFHTVLFKIPCFLRETAHLP